MHMLFKLCSKKEKQADRLGTAAATVQHRVTRTARIVGKLYAGVLVFPEKPEVQLPQGKCCTGHADVPSRNVAQKFVFLRK